jgi:acyl-CoA synthetase (NDP forming)
MVGQRVREYRKPVFIVKPSVEFATDPEASSLFRRERIPVYPNPCCAAMVLKHLAWYRRYLDAARIDPIPLNTLKNQRISLVLIHH